MAATPKSDEIIVKIENVWKVFGSRAEEVIAAVRDGRISKAQALSDYNCVVGVADASFSLRRGEIFCIMGLSGSGKSTLLRHINRLIEPTSGRIEVLGEDLMAMSEAQVRRMRAGRIGMVFQHMALMPHRSVRDNVTFPLEVQRQPKTERWAISQRVLEMVDLNGYEDHMPDQLSGGMRQRVGIARALASDPDILLMDEPFSALDPLTRRQLQDQFATLSRRLGQTTVFITHDLDEAIRLGDRIAMMKDGRIVQIGVPEQIVSNPADAYVADFVRHISTLGVVQARAIMQPISSAPVTQDNPRVAPESDLETLVGVAASRDGVIVVSDGSDDIGVITHKTLFNAIRGARPEVPGNERRDG